MIYLFYLVVYGFLLTAALGLFASWVDRKVTARVQYRVGPPLLQPLIDIVKLMGKETTVPRGASRTTFLLAPVAGIASVILVSALLWVTSLHPAESFVGDWIVALYLLTIPSLSIIIGGFASGNPLASLGSSREMKLVFAYELPFVLAALVPIIHAGMTLRLGEIVLVQQVAGSTAGNLSGMIALVVAVLCVQAKLALVPFDIPEAETEIIHGPLVEYSGSSLALFRLMKNMLLFTLPFFLVLLYLGGIRLEGVHILWSLLKYLVLVAVVTVIRNTNPRVRIDQALRFFWGPMTVLALVAVVLAVLGL